jgi:hypothetical protein
MFSHSQVSKPGFRIESRTTKAWKTLVKRVKEVPPHLVEQIRYVRNIWWVSQLWELCESGTRKEGMADERTGPSAIELDLGVPTA